MCAREQYCAASDSFALGNRTGEGAVPTWHAQMSAREQPTNIRTAACENGGTDNRAYRTAVTTAA